MNEAKIKFQPGEAFALKMDAADPLARFRDRFYIPLKTIYLDGNSLGLMPKSAEEPLNRVLEEWKNKAIGGWLDGESPWFYFAEKLGAMCAELVGAESDEVVCTGTTTINIHSLVSTFYQPKGKRTKILADELNFPTDIYALKGQIKLRNLDPKKHLVLVPSQDGRILDENTIIKSMTDEIAVALLPSVLYRSGQLLDIPLLTKKAHERGIFIGFDCSHSVGAVPHQLSQWEVDFALWCSYKYMNGGPGSPAFLYLNRKHFKREPLLAGWFGYIKEKQFDMLLEFQHAASAGGWQISSPGILGAASLEGCLKIFQEAGIERIREKSIRMTSYLMHLVDHILPENQYHLKIGTPRDPDRRSGHVALEGDEDLWRIHQALKARGVIPDFRPPGLIRFAPIALYNTYHEVWQTIHHLKEIIDTKEYQSFSSTKTAIT
ncbi:MAG: kynureninase [Candidatus Aminicenantes bacterium]|nr:MAG: kynureninase [Candidatus Aminicenantes bacterium]